MYLRGKAASSPLASVVCPAVLFTASWPRGREFARYLRGGAASFVHRKPPNLGVLIREGIFLLGLKVCGSVHLWISSRGQKYMRSFLT